MKKNHNLHLTVDKPFLKRKKLLNILTWFLLTANFLLVNSEVKAQDEVYPASLNTVLTPPYSLFLDNIVSPGSAALSANIIFRDFDEESWNFRLRLTIESQDIRLQTSPNFIPNNPITAIPGELVRFTAEDWSDYLNYNNMVIEGSSVNTFLESGRLPEGFYSFCIEVLDYNTGDPLSRVSCANAWIRLMDPPRLNTPTCGAFVDPKNVQFNFIWQLFNSQSVNSQMGTTYQLTMWEMLDNQADPLSAIPNGQALQVYQSDILTLTSLAYGLSEPPLEVGKRYIYRVQAFDADGKDTFKNNGFSEFCNFYYGWPQDGNVQLLFPEEGGGFKKRDMPYAKWKTVDNILPNELVSYHITVVEIKEGQSREDALFENTPFYYYESLPTALVYEPQLRFNRQLTATKKYAWQVKAYADGLEVGISEVSLFNGPSLVEKFYAGTHLVKVDFLDGNDITKISGSGSIRLTDDFNLWTDIDFKDITLELINGNYIMTGGEFFHSPVKPVVLDISPRFEKNLSASFDINRYRVNKNGLFVYGEFDWTLPHASLSATKPSVISEQKWANYNDYVVTSTFNLASGNQYELLDPFGFTLNLDTTSYVNIYKNKFEFALIGQLSLPEKVNGRIADKRIDYNFVDAKQLFYITTSDNSQTNTIAPLYKGSIYLNSDQYIIDLSEEESPLKFAANKLWKGIYLESYEIDFAGNLDQKAQFSIDQIKRKRIQTAVTDPDAWITSTGLTLSILESFSDTSPMKFQSFPSRLKELNLLIKDNFVEEESILKGDLIIPLIGEDKRFNYEVKIANNGFAEGYLTDLEGTKFTFNKDGGEQLIDVSIKRAVLAGNEKIVMNIDLDWPALGITLKNLRGFSAWGDYNIGFGKKNATVSLIERVNAKLGEFPITLAVIGAGASDGNYAFATKTDINLGDDVSGGEKAPEANIFSIVPSIYAPVGDPYIPEGDEETDQISFEDASSNVQQEYADIENQIRDQLAAIEGLDTGSDAISSSYTVDLRNRIDYDSIANATQVIPTDSLDAEVPAGDFNEEQSTIVRDLVAGFVNESVKLLLKPVTDKIDSVQDVTFGKIDSLQLKVIDWASGPIGETVDFIAEGIIKGLLNDEGDLAGLLTTYSSEVKQALTDELKVALAKSVSDNIKQPIDHLLQKSIKGRVIEHISTNSYDLIYGNIMNLKNGEQLSGAPLKGFVDGVPGVFEGIFKDVGKLLEPDSLYNTVLSLGADFIDNIDTDRLVENLRDRAMDIAADFLKDKAAEAISDLVSDFAEGSGISAFAGGGDGKPLDFIGIGTKLAKGVSVKDAIFIEPVWVNLNTPVLALNGPIQYIPDHPDFGDVWSGDIELKIKVPKVIEFKAIYINGKKDDLNYWFCQIDPVEERGEDEKRKAYEVGKPLAKGARPLKNPANMGIMNLVAASGRVYKHMSEQPGGYILPDAEMNYGAYMNLIFFDKNAQNPGAKMRLEIAGEVNTKVNGDYTIDFAGNVQMQSETHNIEDADPNAAIYGETSIHYNSAEKHFIGYAKVVLYKPGTLCAEGSILVDVKPGKWRVALGSREERLQFVPGCVGWSPTGWLDINQNEAELGLGLQLSAKGSTPKIPIPPFTVKVTAEAGLAFGIMAAVQYRPSFKLLRAGVWAEIWAYVDVEYKAWWKKKWKRKRLIDIYISGDLTFYFVPKPTRMEGKLRGHVKLAGIGVKFKAKFDKEL